MDKKITVSLATIPSREKALKATIFSLINQVDKINVYLNNYKEVPSFLKNNKIEYFQSQNFKDLGDTGKFYWASKISGYHFTCDDDIIYPKDYIKYMIKKLKKYKGFISCHGAIMIEPIISFYKCRKVYHFKNTINEDIKVHILGTGLLAYDADDIKIDLDMFKYDNMADIFIGIFAKKNNIPCYVIKHQEGYIKDYYLDNNSVASKKEAKNSIYFKTVNRDQLQTKVIKSCSPWKNKLNIQNLIFKFNFYHNYKIHFSLHSFKNYKDFRIQKDLITIIGILDDHIFNNIQLTKTFYEFDLLHHLACNIKTSGIAIDVGANIGNHSVFFGKYISKKVISIEPGLKFQKLLLDNLTHNLPKNKFVVCNKGAGKDTRVADLVYPNNNNLGQAKVCNNSKGYKHKISIDTLDNIINDLKIVDQINLIKIDVEGMDLDVLNGAKKLIKKYSPDIVIEAAESRELEKIKRFLNQYHYKIIGKFNYTPTYHFSINPNQITVLPNKSINKKITNLNKFTEVFYKYM